MKKFFLLVILLLGGCGYDLYGAKEIVSPTSLDIYELGLKDLIIIPRDQFTPTVEDKPLKWKKMHKFFVQALKNKWWDIALTIYFTIPQGYRKPNINMNYKDFFPIHFCAAYGGKKAINLVKALLNSGASAMAPTAQGRQTPLFLASRSSNFSPELCNILLSAMLDSLAAINQVPYREDSKKNKTSVKIPFKMPFSEKPEDKKLLQVFFIECATILSENTIYNKQKLTEFREKTMAKLAQLYLYTLFIAKKMLAKIEEENKFKEKKIQAEKTNDPDLLLSTDYLVYQEDLELLTSDGFGKSSINEKAFELSEDEEKIRKYFFTATPKTFSEVLVVKGENEKKNEEVEIKPASTGSIHKFEKAPGGAFKPFDQGEQQIADIGKKPPSDENIIKEKNGSKKTPVSSAISKIGSLEFKKVSSGSQKKQPVISEEKQKEIDEAEKFLENIKKVDENVNEAEEIKLKPSKPHKNNGSGSKIKKIDISGELTGEAEKKLAKELWG